MDDLDDIDYSTSDNRSKTLDLQDQLTVVLKEYDALRKQVDQGSAFMQGLVIPLSVALAGAMIGWQGKIPPEFAVLAFPALIMCGLATAQHGEAYVEKCGQMLAGVEDRVFQMSGIPLLVHETTLAAKRKAAGGRGWWFAVSGVSAVYAICESWLWKNLGWKAFLGVSREMRTIALWGAVAPVLYGFAMAARFQWSRWKWSPTPLAEYLHAKQPLH